MLLYRLLLFVAVVTDPSSMVLGKTHHPNTRDEGEGGADGGEGEGGAGGGEGEGGAGGGEGEGGADGGEGGADGGEGEGGADRRRQLTAITLTTTKPEDLLERKLPRTHIEWTEQVYNYTQGMIGKWHCLKRPLLLSKKQEPYGQTNNKRIPPDAIVVEEGAAVLAYDEHTVEKNKSTYIRVFVVYILDNGERVEGWLTRVFNDEPLMVPVVEGEEGAAGGGEEDDEFLDWVHLENSVAAVGDGGAGGGGSGAGAGGGGSAGGEEEDDWILIPNSSKYNRTELQPIPQETVINLKTKGGCATEPTTPPQPETVQILTIPSRGGGAAVGDAKVPRITEVDGCVGGAVGNATEPTAPPQPETVQILTSSSGEGGGGTAVGDAKDPSIAKVGGCVGGDLNEFPSSITDMLYRKGFYREIEPKNVDKEQWDKCLSGYPLYSHVILADLERIEKKTPQVADVWLRVVWEAVKDLSYYTQEIGVLVTNGLLICEPNVVLGIVLWWNSLFPFNDPSIKLFCFTQLGGVLEERLPIEYKTFEEEGWNELMVSSAYSNRGLGTAFSMFGMSDVDLRRIWNICLTQNLSQHEVKELYLRLVMVHFKSADPKKKKPESHSEPFFTSDGSLLVLVNEAIAAAAAEAEVEAAEAEAEAEVAVEAEPEAEVEVEVEVEAVVEAAEAEAKQVKEPEEIARQSVLGWLQYRNAAAAEAEAKFYCDFIG